MKHARADYDRVQDPAGLIGADEPVFLLRASDRTAPGVVRTWARRQLSLLDHDPALVVLAERQAVAMEAWQREHGRKTADGLVDADEAKAWTPLGGPAVPEPAEPDEHYILVQENICTDPFGDRIAFIAATRVRTPECTSACLCITRRRMQRHNAEDEPT